VLRKFNEFTESIVRETTSSNKYVNFKLVLNFPNWIDSAKTAKGVNELHEYFWSANHYLSCFVRAWNMMFS